MRKRMGGEWMENKARFMLELSKQSKKNRRDEEKQIKPPYTVYLILEDNAHVLHNTCQFISVLFMCN